MSLLAIPGELRGVEKKSFVNLMRLKVVEGVEEKRRDPPLPFVTGAMFPNCLAAVLNGLGGLSVPFRGPGKCQLELCGLEKARFFVGVSKGMFFENE